MRVTVRVKVKPQNVDFSIKRERAKERVEDKDEMERITRRRDVREEKEKIGELLHKCAI